MNDLEKAIINTVAYFDVFDYPLTEFEIWQYIFDEAGDERPVSYGQIIDCLETGGLMGSQIECDQGYYFLSGRREIINYRRQRYAYAERKYMKAIRVIKWLRFFPFVRMVAVCNTLAFNNSRREADIDLFIVTRPGRIWQSRFWVNGFLKIFKMRPSQEKSQDTICSTFFVDEAHLDLHNLLLNESDIYLKYWIRQLVPIYDENVYDDFFSANSWVKKYLPNALMKSLPPRRCVKSVKTAKLFINTISLLFPEIFFKKYQMKIMPRGLKGLANRDTRVIVNDHMLKFHDNDRREQFLSRWNHNRQAAL